MTGGVGGHRGSLAEYAAVDTDLRAHKPAHLSMREASVVPLVFITAWEGMVDRMAVRAGQAVLVLGGAGGVGRMAIQIARARGAEVSATCCCCRSWSQHTRGCWRRCSGSPAPLGWCCSRGSSSAAG